jgi:2-polyprenyl-6-methoxyphenol hydroxylase-like FAD-dependent oxidoreductase
MTKRHAEIVGAGFAGLTAACALAQRGWSVRVHERADRLRTTGAGIYIYENGLRVLEAVGAYDAAIKGAPFAHTREVRDGRDRLISVHRWTGSRVFSVVRQNVINALAAAATRAGVEILTNSAATAATADGELMLADGRSLKADLIVGADGSNSRLRDSLGLLSKRKYLVDGCTRLLMDKTAAERTATDGAKTTEYWSGTRRLLYTPCSETDIYIALTMLDSDDAAKAVPVRKDDWKRAFPHLETLIDRIGEQGRYDRFDLIKLKRWSAGRVAIIGDAAHALPPNIRSVSRIFSACRRHGRRRYAPSSSASPAVRNGSPRSARARPCIGRQGPEAPQNGIVMPSSGASQLTRLTRFQAIMIRPSACTSR